MFRRLQRYIPKDVKGRAQDVKGRAQDVFSHATSAAGHVVGPYKASVEERHLACIATHDENLCQNGDDYIMAPLFDPLLEEDLCLEIDEAHSTQDASVELARAVTAESTHDKPTPPALGGASQPEQVLPPTFGPRFNRHLIGEGPIAAVLVVDFHHLHGAVVEWVHPLHAAPIPASLQESAHGLPTLGVWPSPGEGFAFPELNAWKQQVAVHPPSPLPHTIASLALPDMAHRGLRDGVGSYVFFTLPHDGQLLYGISCFRCVTSPSNAAVRGTIQKAVCVLSHCPFFGLIEQRLSPVTQAFFEQGNFHNTTLLKDFHEQLNAVMFENLSERDLFHGLSHALLFRYFKCRLLSVLKAILLEFKVIVYSPSPETCSRAVLCLLSMLPGGLWFSFNANGFGTRHHNFTKYGLPLQCFGPRCCVYPYLGVQMLDAIQHMQGFLIGTTNRVIQEKLSPDVVLEIPDGALDGALANADGCLLNFYDKEMRELTQCTRSDRVWLQKALVQLEAAMPRSHAKPSSAMVRQVSSGVTPAKSAVPMKVPPVSNPQEPAVEQVSDIEVTRFSGRGADADLSSSPKEFESQAECMSGAVPSSVQTFAMDDDSDDADDIISPEREWGEVCRTASARSATSRLAAVAGAAATKTWKLRRFAKSMHHADGLSFETSSEDVLASSRAVFWSYFEQMLMQTAHVSGSARDITKGLEVAPRELRSELSRFNLAFVQWWVMHTDNGRLWMETHKLPTFATQSCASRNGSGVHKFANGDEYHGEFHCGVRHGQGMYFSAHSGLHYDGNWKQDRRSGHGTLTVVDRKNQFLYTYDGEWFDDQRHGHGSSMRRGKEKYAGQWGRNVYHGVGTLVDANGAILEGEWEFGKLNGVGKYSHSSMVYTGEFKNGQWHGLGQLIRQTPMNEEDADELLGVETLFAGQWHAGSRHGHGKVIYANGEYEGGFEHGVRHGQGILSCGGHRIEGPFVRNMPNMDGIHMLVYPDGTKYTGKVQCNTTDSYGPAFVNRDQDNDKQDPEQEPTSWIAVPHGEGLMKMPDGRVYEGQYQAGQRHGSGMLMMPGKPPTSVRFELGVMQGTP